MFMMPSALSGSWNLSSLFFKLCSKFTRLEDAPFGDDPVINSAGVTAVSSRTLVNDAG